MSTNVTTSVIAGRPLLAAHDRTGLDFAAVVDVQRGDVGSARLLGAVAHSGPAVTTAARAGAVAGETDPNRAALVLSGPSGVDVAGYGGLEVHAGEAAAC